MGSDSRGRSPFDFLRNHPALAAFCWISKAKFNAGNNEKDGSHSQPESAIRQQNSLQRNELRVALERRPVARNAIDGVSAQRIGQCRGHADVQIGRQLTNSKIADQYQYGGNVNRQHLSRERSQGEEDGGGK